MSFDKNKSMKLIGVILLGGFTFSVIAVNLFEIKKFTLFEIKHFYQIPFKSESEDILENTHSKNEQEKIVTSNKESHIGFSVPLTNPSDHQINNENNKNDSAQNYGFKQEDISNIYNIIEFKDKKLSAKKKKKFKKNF